jgi:hypothetical protein
MVDALALLRFVLSLPRGEAAGLLVRSLDPTPKNSRAHVPFAVGTGIAAPPPSTSVPKVGRNEPCTCGSGKKYKRCHGMDGARGIASTAVSDHEIRRMKQQQIEKLALAQLPEATLIT